jgi:hypothetical protein
MSLGRRGIPVWPQGFLPDWNQIAPSGGGGDASTLQGHPASYFATAQIPQYASGSEPTPSASAPSLIIVTSASNPSILKACLPNSAGGYEWVGIGQST